MTNDKDLERLLDTNSNDNAEFKGLKRAAALQSARRKSKLAQNDKFGRKRLVILIVLAIMLLCFFNVTWNEKQFYVTIPEDDVNWPGAKANQSNLTNHLNDLQAVPKGFLVYSDGCQIPDFDPLAANAMKLFHKEKYEDCIPNRKPITRIERNDELETSYLVYDEALKKKYHGNGKFKCCYQEITRSGANKSADNNYNLGKCHDFNKTIELPPTMEYVLVRCKDAKNKAIYTDAHAQILRHPKIEERLENAANIKRDNGTRPLSVLLIGIDSVSRLNLIRAMPHTAQYLYNNQWFELKGYNKIDDNTFPNLMAILTGYNGSAAYHKCNPKSVGKLNQCPFIWRDFQEMGGYTTAYGEDETKINTFNYHKYGFKEQPTDYYLRPFLMAAEKTLHIKYKSTLKYCLGYKTSAEYVYEYGMDFAKTFKNQANFGLFWTNTFSHNAISDPSSMDEKIKDYLIELETNDVLNNSMVIFFSDHGMRFGPIRELEIGWLEERLPFMFMSLPTWFQNQYPQYVNNLRLNRNRLTNPFDIHMTLKHIIELSNSTYVANEKPADGCPTCQSLFYEVPVNRSCADANIEPHWCTCIPFQTFDKNAKVVKLAVEFVINYMNNLLDDYISNNTRRSTLHPNEEANEHIIENDVIAKGKYCAELKIKSVDTVRKGIMEKDHLNEHYLIIFKTSPGDGSFDTTVSHNKRDNTFDLTGSISRLNSYYTDSLCMYNDTLKKYCFCTSNPKNGK